MGKQNKCDHQFSQTKLAFRGKALTYYVIPFDDNLKQKVTYTTANVICDMCNIDQTYKYSKAPVWVKKIMDKLNKDF